MLDQYGRTINYLRLSVTDLCNLKCKYCMPKKGIHKRDHDDILSFESCTSIVKAAAELGVNKVRLTGGEPLVRRGIIDLVHSIAKIDGIEELAMTTNGLLLSKYGEALKKAGLNRVNISIDTLNPIKYSNITRGGNLQDVLDGIETAKLNNLLPIKLNVVIINGFNTDEIEDFIKLASKDIEVRFIELMAIGEAANWSNGKFISNETVYKKYEHLFEERIESNVGPAKYYQRKKFNENDTGGKVGFINPISSHFCDLCNRIRVTPDGKLKTCLHSECEQDIASALNYSITQEEKQAVIKTILLTSIANKPKQHELNNIGFKPIARSMNCIGG